MPVCKRRGCGEESRVARVEFGPTFAQTAPVITLRCNRLCYVIRQKCADVGIPIESDAKKHPHPDLWDIHGRLFEQLGCTVSHADEGLTAMQHDHLGGW